MASPGEPGDARPMDPVLRAARLLGRVAGFVPALLAAVSERPRAPVLPVPATESEVRELAEDLGLPPGRGLREVKLAIADAIPAASDESLARAAEALNGGVPARRVDIVAAILRRLGVP